MIVRLSPQSRATIGVLAALAAVAILTSRPGNPDVDSYASTDYRAGGYRAWAALLAREGVATTRFVLRPIELDDRIDTLVSAQPLPGSTDPTARTAADIAALARWVRAGGRLVYIGRNSAVADVETQLLDLPFFLPDVGSRDALQGPLAADVAALRDLGTNRMLLVEHTGQAELSDGNGDIVVRYPFGRGEIVAVVDAVPFINTNIATPGNARLAYLVGRPRKPGGVVAFDDGVHGALIDRPWYRALPIPVRVGLGIAALAALLAAIGSAMRSGPAVALRPAREPTSEEFVAALAALYERTHARSAASAILIHDALAAAQRGSGATDEDVHRLAAMLDAPVPTDPDLLASGKLANRVRKESIHGRNDGRRAAFAGRTRTRRRR